MKRIIFLLFLQVLSGCELLLYRESYTIDNMVLWKHFNSNEQVSLDIKNECYEHAKSISEHNYKDLYGKCLYDKGFRFRTESFLYCYHRKNECSVFNKYRK